MSQNVFLLCRLNGVGVVIQTGTCRKFIKRKTHSIVLQVESFWLIPFLLSFIKTSRWLIYWNYLSFLFHVGIPIWISPIHTAHTCELIFISSYTFVMYCRFILRMKQFYSHTAHIYHSCLVYIYVFSHLLNVYIHFISFLYTRRSVSAPQCRIASAGVTGVGADPIVAISVGASCWFVECRLHNMGGDKRGV